MQVDVGLGWDFRERGRGGEFDIGLVVGSGKDDSTVTLARTEEGRSGLIAERPEGSLLISRKSSNLMS